MDGVLYRGRRAIAGVPEAISALRKKGVKLFFLTNNATRTRSTLARRLSKMGLIASVSEIDTSAFAAAKFIYAKKKNARVLVFGEQGLRQEIKSAGLQIAKAGDEKTDFLVSGLDRHATYAKLRDATNALRDGAFWVACNMDPTLPMHDGTYWPGSGSLASALAFASGRNPDIIVGKPNPAILASIFSDCAKHGIGKKEIALVGDRIEIDVALANSSGITSILVLTGVASAKDAKKAKGKNKPKITLRSAAEITELFSNF